MWVESSQGTHGWVPGLQLRFSSPARGAAPATGQRGGAGRMGWHVCEWELGGAERSGRNNNGREGRTINEGGA